MFKKLMLSAAAIIAFAGTSVPAWAAQSDDNENRAIRIQNRSGYTVYRVYYGVPGGGWYTRDLLDTSVINDDDDFVVEPDNGGGRCVYRLRAETEDGQYWQKTLNVCREASWRLTA